MQTNGNCESAIQHLIAELEVNPHSQKIFEELLIIYPECHDALSEVFESWTHLGLLKVPEPRAEMHANFYRALNEFKISRRDQEPGTRKTFLLQFMRYAAVGLALMTAGVFIGREIGLEKHPGFAFGHELNTGNELTNVNWNSSTTHKLEIIENARRRNQPNQAVLAAVNSALCHDESVNVRLSSIETLLHFSEYPQARTFLIKAIPLQDSPMVQMALADAITSIEERSAIQSLEDMIKSGKLGLEVEDHYENAIKILMQMRSL